MTTINHTATVFTDGGVQWYIISWTPLSSGDEGDKVQRAGAADRSVQVVGGFNGATLSLLGSNDGVNFEILHDPQGVPLAFSGSGIRAISEATRYAYPLMSGGDVGTSVSVTMLSKTMVGG